MSREITHVARDGRLVQIVSAARLREILRSDGDTLDRPRDWEDEDEWDVGDPETGES